MDGRCRKKKITIARKLQGQQHPRKTTTNNIYIPSRIISRDLATPLFEVPTQSMASYVVYPTALQLAYSFATVFPLNEASIVLFVILQIHQVKNVPMVTIYLAMPSSSAGRHSPRMCNGRRCLPEAFDGRTLLNRNIVTFAWTNVNLMARRTGQRLARIMATTCPTWRGRQILTPPC